MSQKQGLIEVFVNDSNEISIVYGRRNGDDMSFDFFSLPINDARTLAEMVGAEVFEADRAEAE